MKYLIIHPKDETTDFLKVIYENLENKTVIDTDFNSIETELKKDYDMIILLGHGWLGGLYDRKSRTTIFPSQFAEYLKNKNVIGIWCEASDYFSLYNVEGFCTGMFISETEEANDCNVVATKEQILESSNLFANVVKSAVNEKVPVNEIKNYVKENYTTANNNPVIKINRQFMDIDPWDNY